MTHFAIPDGELSPAEAEFSTGLSQITETATHYGLLLRVVNRSVIVRLVSIAQFRDAGGRRTR
jgi:hypothetical protein